MLSRLELDQLIADFAAYRSTDGFNGLPEEMQALLLRMNRAVIELRDLRQSAVATAA